MGAGPYGRELHLLGVFWPVCALTPRFLLRLLGDGPAESQGAGKGVPSSPETKAQHNIPCEDTRTGSGESFSAGCI